MKCVNCPFYYCDSYEEQYYVCAYNLDGTIPNRKEDGCKCNVKEITKLEKLQRAMENKYLHIEKLEFNNDFAEKREFVNYYDKLIERYYWKE